MTLEKIALEIPKLLLPKPEFREVWSVVACDQFTSEPEYWVKVAEVVGNKPSTLNIILPEVYLESPEEGKMIEEKVVNMKNYIDKGIFEEKSALVYLERSTKNIPLRRGLVVALDLDAYSFKKGDAALIRPTEQTVVERIPPRLKVRSRALIESPHILILINDAKRSVIEPLTAKKGSLSVLYDQDLMLGAGHIKGYAVQGADADGVAQALTGLLNLQSGSANPFLYAVGDGNHSLATAKQSWENIKQTFATKSAEEQKNLLKTHPARYCLVELSNIYDEGNEFESIHRVLFNTTTSLVGALEKKYGSQGFSKNTLASYEELKKAVYASAAGGKATAHHVGIIEGGKFYDVGLPLSLHKIPVGAIQQFLDSPDYKPTFGKIDYIHGDDVILRLSTQPANIGVLLPPLPKDALFPAVESGGVLPRKTFSMGEADEKRFYFECRKIVLE